MRWGSVLISAIVNDTLAKVPLNTVLRIKIHGWQNTQFKTTLKIALKSRFHLDGATNFYSDRVSHNIENSDCPKHSFRINRWYISFQQNKNGKLSQPDKVHGGPILTHFRCSDKPRLVVNLNWSQLNRITLLLEMLLLLSFFRSLVCSSPARSFARLLARPLERHI